MPRTRARARKWQEAADRHEAAAMKLLDPYLDFRERARWQKAADAAQEDMDRLHGEQ